MEKNQRPKFLEENVAIVKIQVENLSIYVDIDTYTHRLYIYICVYSFIVFSLHLTIFSSCLLLFSLTQKRQNSQARLVLLCL